MQLLPLFRDNGRIITGRIYKLWHQTMLLSNLISPTHLTVCTDLIFCCPSEIAYPSCMPSASHLIHKCLFGFWFACHLIWGRSTKMIHLGRCFFVPPFIHSIPRWVPTLNWVTWVTWQWLAPRLRSLQIFSMWWRWEAKWLCLKLNKCVVIFHPALEAVHQTKPFCHAALSVLPMRPSWGSAFSRQCFRWHLVGSLRGSKASSGEAFPAQCSGRLVTATGLIQWP